MDNNNRWGFGIIVAVIVISLIVILFGFKNTLKKEPSLVYTVYLDGDYIGTIASRDSFEEFINLKEEELKKRYRGLIKDFLNEVVYRSHKFSRENFLDRRGRHRVYGIIRKIDENLDALAEELISDEQDHLAILNRIGEIEGLLLDIFA